MLRKVSIFILLIIGLSACKSDTEKKTEVKKPVVQPVANELEAEPIQLNEGKAWEADASTIQGVEIMTLQINQFGADGQQDFKKLGNELEQTLNEIFKQCTMKGPAHDALHKYLVPIQKNIAILKSDKKEQHFNALENLRNQTATFQHTFQPLTGQAQ